MTCRPIYVGHPRIKSLAPGPQRRSCGFLAC